MRCFENLLFGLYRAWPGDDWYVVPAERNAGSYRDNRAFGTPLARYLLVRLCDVNDLRGAGKRSEARAVDPPVIAHHTDGGTLRAGHRARLISHLPDYLDYTVDLGGRRTVVHYDKHDQAVRAASRWGAAIVPAIASSTAAPFM